jgi:hypothetical protein
MPPMSVLSMPPPPPPGGAPEPPGVPGAIPRLSLSKPHEKSSAPFPKAGLNIKVVAEPAVKMGGKPVAIPPGKKGAVLRRRATLSPVMKAGVAFVIVAFAIGGVYTYRIFFPAPSREVPIKSTPIAKPGPKKDLEAEAADSLNRITSGPGKLMDKAQNAIANRRADEQAKVDAAITGLEEPSPTPATISVMAEAQLTTDIKVNSTRLEAAPAASAEFRVFVGNASVGGVFQGTPSRALVNGVIVREGQTVNAALGITFDRVDAVKKMIYFKDATGAEVSKSY